MKTKTSPTTNSMSRSFLRSALLLIPLVLVCFGLLPRAQATDLDSVLPNGNTAEGSGVLVSLTSGVWNSGFGFEALNHDTAGKSNTATGVRALFSNTTGSNNTANGVYALYGNTIGWYNNAVGAYALANNTEGNWNTANGYGALYYNTEGDKNTANGAFALFHNTTGHDNAANGQAALVNNTTGNDNTADGVTALDNNTTGNNNIALGSTAGFNLTTGDFNIDIGNNGVAGEAFTIRIGDVEAQTRAFIAGIFAVPVTGTGVVVASDGQLGVAASSQRFKDEIKPMDKASEAILALKPVTFRYKHEIDPKRIPQFGLVAEEVAKVNPDLVACDAKGEIYTVRYDAVNAMLLNEFLKEHRKVEQQEATITQLKKDFQATVAELNARLKEQDSKIEKVNAQLEVSKTAPQIVLNNQ